MTVKARADDGRLITRRSRGFVCGTRRRWPALFSDVLLLCKQAGLVTVGVIAIDGTKVHANASHHSNLDYEQLAREILKEAGEVDQAEDEQYGDARGDELPEHLRTREGRRAALREAKEKLERIAAMISWTWAGQPGSAAPCCAAAVQRGSPASSLASDADRGNQELRRRSWKPPQSQINSSCCSTRPEPQPNLQPDCRVQALPWGHHEALSPEHDPRTREAVAER